jgi:hypothetical protein
MRLHTRRRNLWGDTKPSDCGITHTGECGVADATFAMSFKVAKNIAKNLNAVFTYQVTELPVGSGRGVAGPQQRLANDTEIKTTCGVMPSLCIVPKGLLTNKVGADQACAFGHGDISAVFYDVPDRRAAVIFSNGLHSARKHKSSTEINRNLGGID